MPACRSCGWDNPPGAEVCRACGEPIASSHEGERRQLTVMFCDLVESTSLAHPLDPEDLRDVLTAYVETCSAVIERLEGYVAQILGDGMLVYFGYPRAHEEDALRAVKAALEILAAVPALSDRLAERVPILRERPLRVRIGVHTGPVLIDEIGSRDRHELLALGDTVNLAARLLAVASPGHAVVSASTRCLVEGAFVFEDLGLHELRGISEAVRVHGVVRASSAADERVHAPWRSTPFVDREHELAFLLESWGRVCRGDGRMLLVRGDAGIGKSRLVRRFSQLSADRPRFWFECHCSPFRRHSAFYPVLSALARELGFRADDPPQAKLARLAEFVAQAPLTADDALPLLATFFSLPLPPNEPAAALTPEARRRRTVEILVDWLIRLAEERPTILVVEDLQWIDPSTFDLMHRFLARIRDAPVLGLFTARTEFDCDWEASARMEELRIEPMAEPDLAAMVESIADGELLPSVVTVVVQKADGVPLFAEELTRAVVEQYAAERERPRTETGVEVSIPSTLQSSLLERLDRLGTARGVAQLAATIGREFSRELLEAISPQDPGSLRRELDRLEAVRIVQRGHDDSTFVFRHALIQETAYRSLLKRRRKALHGRIAAVLRERFPARVVADPEVMAWHCTMAGLTEDAVTHRERAAEKAMRASAQSEAIGHLMAALKLLSKMPESPERSRRELSLRIALGVPLIGTKGYGHPDVVQTHLRARELAREVGAGPDLYQALGGIYLFHTARAELKPAAELASELLELGERAGDRFVRQWGHFFSAPPFYYHGDFAEALDHTERSIELHDDDQRHDWYVHEHDADVSARVYAAMALWNLGSPDRAAQRMEEAVALGERSPHPWNHAFALGFAALFHQMRRETDRVLARAQQAVEVAAEQAFPLWLGIGTVLRGWARAQTGEDAVDEVLDGLGISSITGTRIEGPRVLALLAETYRASGRGGEALDALDSALALARQHDCHYWDAELDRLKGETLLHEHGSEAEAEGRFLRALQVARRQGARSLELRSATSLARLRRSQGRAAECEALLEPLYERFTEGHQTPDLRESRLLLEELRAARRSAHRAGER